MKTPLGLVHAAREPEILIAVVERDHAFDRRGLHVLRRDLLGGFRRGPLPEVAAVTERRIRPAPRANVRHPALMSMIGNDQQAIASRSGQRCQSFQRLFPAQSVGAVRDVLAPHRRAAVDEGLGTSQRTADRVIVPEMDRLPVGDHLVSAVGIRFAFVAENGVAVEVRQRAVGLLRRSTPRQNDVVLFVAAILDQSQFRLPPVNAIVRFRVLAQHRLDGGPVGVGARAEREVFSASPDARAAISCGPAPLCPIVIVTYHMRKRPSDSRITLPQAQSVSACGLSGQTIG